MATITVVEPNTLLRSGILKLLQSLDCALAATGIDYVQLFQGASAQTSTDLMLLSVPGSYARMTELISAAQQSYAPRRILLLSDTHTLPYSLLNLPPALAGYISKYSSQDVLKTSVMLVLAGGKCFPHPHMFPADDANEDATYPDASAPPKRRWYDQHEMPPDVRADESEPDNFLRHPEPGHAPARQRAPLDPAPTSEQTAQGPTLTQELISREAHLLRLTPRQYEVLALLAKGYPLKTISRELHISLATAKTHTEALYQRLSVNSRNAAVYAALSKGATLGWHEPGQPPALPAEDPAWPDAD